MKHFVIGNIDKDLIQEFFVDGDICEVIHIDTRIVEELSVLAGIFPSVTQARKNTLKSWFPIEKKGIPETITNEVPTGISQIGTSKKRFWVWRKP